MRLLIVSPAYNEEKNVAAVVESLKKEFPAADVLVVDDGSRDETARVARAAGARVVRLPFNLGIGGAVQTGFLYAARGGYDAACQVDADGQHPADQLKLQVERAPPSEADVIVGSRFLAESEYRGVWTRRAGIAVLAKTISALTGQRVTDPTSGLRVVKGRALELFSRYYPEDYPEPESLVMLHRARLKFEEYPVRMLPRKTGTSSISPLGAVYYMVKVLLAILINLFRKPPAIGQTDVQNEPNA